MNKIKIAKQCGNFKNGIVKGMTVAESLEDSKGDQKANEYGREQVNRTGFNPSKCNKSNILGFRLTFV